MTASHTKPFGCTLRPVLTGLLVAGALLFLGGQVSQAAEETGSSEARLVQQIKSEILAELLDNKDFLQQITEAVLTQLQQNEALAQHLQKQVGKQVTQEVLSELQHGEFLTQQIARGIQDYVQKQRRAQQEARAKRQRLAQEKAKNVRRVSKTRDHIFGNPDAVISLIEYSDYECPYCKRFHPTAKKIVEAYQGKVNWVYRHFPLGFHNPGAQKEAEASECVNVLGGNEAFWKYTDLVYARTTSNGKGFPIAKLVPLAVEIGLDRDKFQDCLDSGRYAARVQEDLAEGSKSGITGTPGNILLHNTTGEVRLKSGAQPFAAFKADIDRMLK